MSKLLSRSIRSGSIPDSTSDSGSPKKHVVAGGGAIPRVVSMPQEVRDADAQPAGHIKVECALKLAGHAVVVGWSVGPIRLQMGAMSSTSAPAQELRLDRADVAAHFSLPSTEKYGFVLVAPIDRGESEVNFGWSAGGNAVAELLPLVESTDHPALRQAAPIIAASFVSCFPPFSPAWTTLLGGAMPIPTREASGVLEAAAVFEPGEQAVLAGWVVSRPGTVVWIQDSNGAMHSLESACWRNRSDVYEATGGRFGAAALQSGFVTRIDRRKEVEWYRLMALSADGVHLLAEAKPTTVSSDPRAASRWLFGIDVPNGSLQHRFDSIGHPLLSNLITKAQESWASLPVVHRQCGRSVVQSPTVSVVVPLHGRFDFVENQMLEWSRDPWIRQHAQLIYVVDDPAILDCFHPYAEELAALYGISFEWIWGGVNRGFSGANNLGASIAKASYLLFLNSDVFPQQPGWLLPLVEVLDQHGDVGVVGPRLLFAEGGIQHAGMEFQRVEQYGVWINRHRRMGLDPVLDPLKDLTVVPAVTGACMLLRRRDFDAVGGWDTGYLIGDFEDSDLCLKLRSAGLASAYLPTVQLTHLERQSMRALGSGEYRMRVTLWNALRHQHRWGELIAQQQAEVCA